jgi:tetratricopeptide (TPR) repeat protein
MTGDKDRNEIEVLWGNQSMSRNTSSLIEDIDLTSESQAVEGKSLQPIQTPAVHTTADSAAVETLGASEFFKQGLDKFQRGDYRRAIQDFNEALRINPDLADSEAVASLQASAYYYRGMSRYKKGDSLGAIQDYSQVLGINPHHVEAYSNRGWIRSELGDRWGAMQDYNQALQIDSVHIKTYLNRSSLRVELEDYQGAIADCNAVLHINPNLPKAYLNRGLARFELEDYQKAMDDYNQVLQINPNIAEAYFNRGLNQIALGDYQDAIADFNQALQLNPDYTQAYLNRGYTRLQVGDNWGSIEDFDQALKLDPVSAKAFFSHMAPKLKDEQEIFEDETQQLIQGLIIQGTLRYESGDYQAALNALNQALNLDPNNIEAYNKRSTVRSALRDYQGALEDLEKATNLSLSNQQSLPSTPVATVEPTAQDYYQRGVDKLHTEDFQGAIADFTQVLEMNGNDATTLTCRGFAYRRLGDAQRAIADLQAAAKLFSEQGDVKSSQEIVETIKKLQQ